MTYSSLRDFIAELEKRGELVRHAHPQILMYHQGTLLFSRLGILLPFASPQRV
jgi:hypothetical protein